MTGDDDSIISAILIGYIDGDAAPCMFMWHPDHPAAVTVVFGTADFRWTFARDLLDGGGEGDVHVFRDPIRGVTAITLRNPSSEPPSATVQFRGDALDQFLAHTRRACPDDQVTYDVDAWLREATS